MTRTRLLGRFAGPRSPQRLRRGAPATRLFPVVAWLWAAAFAAAEQLPVRLFTSADGLAGECVLSLAEDPAGFLWVGTETGLSRFDGYGFTTFGMLEGLPHPAVNALQVTADGRLWVGTSGGVARFRDAPATSESSFEVLSLGTRTDNFVRALAEDGAGTLWVGSAGGLFAVRCRPSGPCEVQRVPLAVEPGQRVAIHHLAIGADDHLWLGTGHELLERSPDGRVATYHVAPNAEEWDPVRGLRFDSEGVLWVTHDVGVFALRLPLPAAARSQTISSLAGASSSASPAPVPADDRPWQPPAAAGGIAYRAPLVPLSTGLRFTAVLPLAGDGAGDGVGGGTVWVATAGGLMQLADGRWRQLGVAQGVVDSELTALFADSAGNLWVGSDKRGLMRLAANGFLSYGRLDGLASVRVSTIFEDPAGDLVVAVNGDGRDHYYRVEPGRVADGRFAEITPTFLDRIRRFGWGWNQTAMIDHAGEWWLPSAQGLLRFPAVPARALRTTAPVHVYTRATGMPGEDVFRIFEDHHGDLWLGLLDVPQPLVRWRRSTGAFETVAIPRPLPVASPTAFVEDGAGNLWVGFYDGGLARFGADGSVRAFPVGPEVPAGFVYDLLLDRRGRLWTAANTGAVRIDDPAGETPRFRRYAVAGGLARDSLRALGEDGAGRIFLGSARGLDRLDPETGRIESFTTGDGLANNMVNVIYRDRGDGMWFGTLQGLSRLATGQGLSRLATGTAASPPRASSGLAHLRQPRVSITGVEVAGLRQSASEALELVPGGNRLQIDFAGVSLASGASLRYETRLVGLDPAWSGPSPNRSVLLAGLPPGRYRFEVRAVAGSGEVSGEPARVDFRVLPPVWRRGWFLSALGLAAALAAWGGHRYRLARLLALERIRTRIASDLHDEVGASLSRVSILTEVGKLRLGEEGDAEAAALLSEIGDTSRELSESMSDIVWALDPRKDDLASLIARLRRFASDVLEAQGVALDFTAPAAGVDLHLASAERRELFLLLKEAVHNTAKHARATRVEVRLVATAGWLRVEVRDDGVGLPLTLTGNAASPGLGLTSMRQRASLLGAELTIDSPPGGGTSVRAEVPLSAWKRARRSR